MTLWHLNKRNFSNFCILFISQSTRYTNWGTQGDRKGWDDDKIQMIVELALLHIFRKTGYLSWHICQKCGVRLLPISISPKIEHDVHCSGLNMAYKSLKIQTIFSLTLWSLGKSSIKQPGQLCSGSGEHLNVTSSNLFHLAVLKGHVRFRLNSWRLESRNSDFTLEWSNVLNNVTWFDITVELRFWKTEDKVDEASMIWYI